MITEQTITQINDEHHKVIAAESNALSFAMQCGDLLREAKEHVKDSKLGKWTDWLARNCPDIKERTAQLYMQLANGREKIEEKIRNGVTLSIREARGLIKKQKTEAEKAKEKVKQEEASDRFTSKYLHGLTPEKLVYDIRRSRSDKEAKDWLESLAAVVDEALQEINPANESTAEQEGAATKGDGLYIPPKADHIKEEFCRRV